MTSQTPAEHSRAPSPLATGCFEDKEWICSGAREVKMDSRGRAQSWQQVRLGIRIPAFTNWWKSSPGSEAEAGTPLALYSQAIMKLNIVN